MQVSNVSFKGIYDINFSKNSKKEDVEEIYNKVNDYVQEQPYLKTAVHIFNFNKFENPLDRKGFRIVTALDNPNIMLSLLSLVNDDLAQQYIEKTKINLTV